MLYYVIPTNPKYYDLAVPKLLNSLKTDKKILIAFNNATEYKLESDPNTNITSVHLTHNCYEYAGFVAAAKVLEPTDYIFLLHDTCEAGPDFVNIIESFPYDKYDHVDVYDGLCNFGLYKVSLLQQHSALVESMKDIDKRKAVVLEKSVHHLPCNKTRFPSRPGLKDYNSLGTNTGVYKTGVVRLTEYYGNIDLYKFKANWNGFVPNWNVQL
jgi:hypothetical protein